MARPPVRAAATATPPSRIEAAVSRGVRPDPAEREASRLRTARPVMLFGVMGVLVHDPFFVEVPAFFATDLHTLVQQRHPTAWVEFELGAIDEVELGRRFFADERELDVASLK